MEVSVRYLSFEITFCKVTAILLTLTFVAFLPYHWAKAQTTTSTVVGIITDQSGAVIPEATVTILNQATHVTNTGKTNESGNYTFSFVPPGLYTVNVAAQGFSQQSIRNINVPVNQTARVNVTMTPGVSSTTITVTSSAPLLQMDRPDVIGHISTHQVQQLPLNSEQNFQELEMLIPGVSTPFHDHSSFFDAQNSEGFQVNGQSELSSNTMIEGIDDNESTGLLQVYIPPAAAIQSVSVITSNYAPEFGRASGAITNVILKSGTNHFHGSVYEFNEVSALAARSYFERTGAFPRTTNNLYGATFGGPITKNRAFLFGDYEGYRSDAGQFNLESVPTAAFRAGNFSGAPTAIYDPDTGSPDGTGRQQFDYNGKPNVIPPSRLNPISEKLENLIPLPNVPGAGFTNNYAANTAFTTNTNTFDIKATQRILSEDSLDERFSWQRTDLYQEPIFGLAGGPAQGGNEGTGTNTVYNTGLSYTHVFSPTLVTYFRGGVDHYRNIAQQSDYGSNMSTQLGIPGINRTPFSSGLLDISIGGYPSPLLGYSSNEPWIRTESNIELVNSWSKSLGNHSIQMGFQFHRVRTNLTQGHQFGPRGIYNYSDGQTGLNSAGSQTSFANDFASFLLDLPSSTGQDVNITSQSWRQSYYSSYAQDTWNTTPKLTLTYGIRWDFYPAAHPDRKGGFSQYDPATNSLHVAGYGDIPSDLGMSTNWHDFEPRLGFAYRATSNTVIRGGFGDSYTQFQDNRYAYNYPILQNIGFNSPNGFTPAVYTNGSPVTLESGFPVAPAPIIPSSGIIQDVNNSTGYFVVNQHYHDPYVIFYNLAVQQNLGCGWTGTLSYVGNLGRFIPVDYNLNAGQIAGAGVEGQPYFRLYGNSSFIDLIPTGSSSNYNSLQARLQHRFRTGLEFTSAFAWQKSMGFISSRGSLASLNFYLDPQRDYAPLSWNHSVTSTNSFIYQLPFGHGKEFLRSGPIATIAGGWQVSGLLSMMTGTPLFFSASGSQLDAPGTTQVPNEVKPFRRLHGIGTQHAWFDPSAFVQPQGAVLGSAGKNVYSGPGSFSLDLSTARSFRFPRGTSFEFRANAFNVLNHPVFSTPDTSLTDADFGDVTSSGSGRSMQLSGTLTF